MTGVPSSTMRLNSPFDDVSMCLFEMVCFYPKQRRVAAPGKVFLRFRLNARYPGIAALHLETAIAMSLIFTR
jgi:hypothetical protein